MFELPALDLRKRWKPIRTLAGAARRWAHAHRIFHMDALGLIMGLTGSSGLRIVAAGTDISSCTINANGATCALGIVTFFSASSTVCAFAITKTSATFNALTQQTIVTTYTLTLESNISLVGGSGSSSINAIVIGLA